MKTVFDFEKSQTDNTRLRSNYQSKTPNFSPDKALKLERLKSERDQFLGDSVHPGGLILVSIILAINKSSIFGWCLIKRMLTVTLIGITLIFVFFCHIT